METGITEASENGLSKKISREEILGFQELLAEQPDAVFGDSSACPLKHTFSDGIYVREIFIPAGTLLTGKIHKHSHPNFLMLGTVDVATEQGLERLTGPLSMISLAGTKRVVYAITDCTWITVHENLSNTNDLNELEDNIIAKSYEEYELFLESKETKTLR